MNPPPFFRTHLMHNPMGDIDCRPEAFAPPHVQDILIRDRLDTLLDAAYFTPLILVQGQAAQGKSTLIASYLNRSTDQNPARTHPFTDEKTPDPHNEITYPPRQMHQHQQAPHPMGIGRKAIWLHLSRRESSHTQLFERIIDALSSTLPPSHPALNSMVTPGATLGTGEEMARQAEILHGLCSVVPDPVALVLDNLDALDDDASSHRLIKSMANVLLPGNTPVQLILISRQHPGLGISMLKLEHSALTLTNEMLAFTPNETRDYFTRCKGMTLPSETIDYIHTLTHGWAGGLSLIGASLERGVDISRWPHHLTAETLNYFSNEIFDLMPDPVRRFLMKISQFDEINTEIAEHLCDTPTPVAKEMLHYLTTHHLFIHPLVNSGKIPAYRLNTLFRNFLFKALMETTAPQDLKQTSRNAARFFESRGATIHAVQHAIDGEDFHLAVRMIKKSATDLIIRGRLPNLAHWLNALPPAMISQDPWLIFYRTITQRIRGGRQNVTDFITAKMGFQKNDDTRGAILSTAFLIEAAVFVRKPSTQIAQWIADGEALLFGLHGSTRFSWAQALLWQQIAFGYIAGEVDIQKGISACRNARLLANKIKNSEIQRNASIVMAFGFVRSGNIAEAETALETLKGITDEGIHPEYRVLNQLVRIDFSLKQGDFTGAKTHLEKTADDVEKFGLIFLYPEFIELKAMHAIYTNQFEAAMGFADHLSDFSILSGNRFYLALASHIKALVHYHGSSTAPVASPSSPPLFSLSEPWCIETALKHSKEALTLFREKEEVSSYYFLATLLHGILLMKTKQFQRSQKEVKDTLDHLPHAASDLTFCEAQAILGLISWEIGTWRTDNGYALKESSHHILTALTQAYHEGFRRFSLLAPNDHLTLLTLGIAFDASQTLFSPLTALMKPWEKSILNHLSPLLSHPQIQADPSRLGRLKNLYRYFMPPITITTLGRFSVVIGDHPLDDKAWEGKKPKLLLKAMICHGIHTRSVPKEKLIEDLWPDSAPKSGEKNFKVTLHRIRKALEPHIHPEVGYSYVTLDGGTLSLHPDLITVDIIRFEQLITDGEIHLARNEEAHALSLFEQAVALYHGDFLMDDLYESWIEKKRSALKERFISLLLTIARIHEEQDEATPAIRYLKRAIDAAPLNEEAYRQLMIVYADCAMKSEAMALYETCRQTLLTELDVLPDHETRQIFEKIKSLS